MKTIDTITVEELLTDIKNECKRVERGEVTYCNDCKYFNFCCADMYYVSASDILEGMYKAFGGEK